MGIFTAVSGFEVNLGFLDLEYMDTFLNSLTSADTEEKLVDALKEKSRWSNKINEDIVKFKMQQAMKMTKPKLKMTTKTNTSNKK